MNKKKIAYLRNQFRKASHNPIVFSQTKIFWLQLLIKIKNKVKIQIYDFSLRKNEREKKRERFSHKFSSYPSSLPSLFYRTHIYQSNHIRNFF